MCEFRWSSTLTMTDFTSNRLIISVLGKTTLCKSDVGLTVHRNSVWIRKTQLDVTFCILYFSSNSCSTCFGQPCAHHQELRLRDFIASCWYVPWLREGCQVWLAGSASMDGLVRTNPWTHPSQNKNFVHQVG